MPTVEDQLGQVFHTHVPRGEVRIDAAIEAGKQRCRRRRATSIVAYAGALLVSASVVAVTVSSQTPDLQLVGSGLTLSGGSGVAQVSTNTADLGDGVQAWREGDALVVGYPDGTNMAVSTQGGDVGSDPASVTGPEAGLNRTLLLGVVQGDPTSVLIRSQGVEVAAAVGCFEQTPGWCVYKAILPFPDAVDVEVIVELEDN